MFQYKNSGLTILMVLAMTTWGLSWTNAKILGQYADAPLIMFWRFTFASIFFSLIIKLLNFSFNIPRKALPIITLNSIFMVSYNYFYFRGTQVGLAGIGGVLVTTLNPLLTTIFTNIILKEHLSKKDVLGLGLGLLGSLIILKFWKINIYSLLLSGNLFFVFASLSWAFVTITTSKSKLIIAFLPYSFWSFTFSALISLLFSFNANLFSIFHFDIVFWANLLALSVFAMAFGTSIYFFASTEFGPKKASSFIFLVPPTAIIFAAYFIAEPIQISTLIGGVLGMLAVYIINFK